APGGLAPLSELGLRVIFQDTYTGREHPTDVSLGAAQLGRSEALVTAVCPEPPRAPGVWWVHWKVGARTLVTQRAYAVPAARFAAGVKVLEARFVLEDEKGATRTSKLPPGPGEAVRVGPCFVLAGGEPGAAGVCWFEVSGFASNGSEPVVWYAADAVVTDGPTVFAPKLFDVSELARVSGFELRLNDRVLGVASLRPVPAARLTGEGGFIPPPEFTWSAAADDELNDRLRKLQ
ncbi:MAG: hypothetical protein K2V38_07920, partial [Gemmataceae bacterium]|nr:hypothetical protein [Gemmataceae bacterium]